MVPPPLTRRVDVALHIGMGKTGTSSIQYFCRDNRPALASHGLLYPESPGAARHYKVSLSVKSPAELERSPLWLRQTHTDPERFRRWFRRCLRDEIEASGLSRVLLSDEGIYGSSQQSLERLGRWMSRTASTHRVVVYLRRQDDHLVSRYQQEIKVGAVERLQDWAGRDMKGVYDYDDRLSRIRRGMVPTEIVVRPFERSSFVNGSLLQDFLDAVGVDARASEMTQVVDRNASLDAESVEFLRLLNLHRLEDPSARRGIFDNRELVTVLAEASTGPVLTLPEAALDRFMAQWKQSNQLVAREYLGRRLGRLFKAPRKEGNTTSDQRLDPRRLDHYLALCRLPEESHAPLRALAEREAVVR
jgi:hypothetical protein